MEKFKGNKLIISCDKNRRLISLCRQHEIKLINPKGVRNSYGYVALPLSAVIETQEQYNLFMNLVDTVEKLPIPSPKSKETIILSWAKRLSKLGCISLDEATGIAKELLQHNANQIALLTRKQLQHGAIEKRDRLIKKLQKSNPLRRIKDTDEAMKIISTTNNHIRNKKRTNSLI